MKTKHIVSVKHGVLISGDLGTTESCARIKVVTDGSPSVEVTIEGQWMKSSDLLEAAKLFKKMAKVLATAE